jgi:hypothetical protein
VKTTIFIFSLLMGSLLCLSTYAQPVDRFSELDAIKNRTQLRMRDLELVTRGMTGPEKTTAIDINHKHVLTSTLIANGQDIVYFLMQADGRERNTQVAYGKSRLRQLIQLLESEMAELASLSENSDN